MILLPTSLYKIYSAIEKCAEIDERTLGKIGAKLSYRARQRLPDSAFAIPEERKYPIHDMTHARNALARVSAFGTPDEKERVRRAVYARYPELKGGK